jgi:hypothetical protein
MLPFLTRPAAVAKNSWQERAAEQIIHEDSTSEGQHAAGRTHGQQQKQQAGQPGIWRKQGQHRQQKAVWQGQEIYKCAIGMGLV